MARIVRGFMNMFAGQNNNQAPNRGPQPVPAPRAAPRPVLPPVNAVAANSLVDAKQGLQETAGSNALNPNIFPIAAFEYQGFDPAPVMEMISTWDESKVIALALVGVVIGRITDKKFANVRLFGDDEEKVRFVEMTEEKKIEVDDQNRPVMHTLSNLINSFRNGNKLDGFTYSQVASLSVMMGYRNLINNNVFKHYLTGHYGLPKYAIAGQAWSFDFSANLPLSQDGFNKSAAMRVFRSSMIRGYICPSIQVMMTQVNTAIKFQNDVEADIHRRDNRHVVVAYNPVVYNVEAVQIEFDRICLVHSPSMAGFDVRIIIDSVTANNGERNNERTSDNASNTAKQKKAMVAFNVINEAIDQVNAARGFYDG